MIATYKIVARASGLLPSSSIFVLYGRDWELCEGSEGLTFEEARELKDAWIKDDRRAQRDNGMHRCLAPHDYSIVME